MKRSFVIYAVVLVLSVALLAGCKKPAATSNVDGGEELTYWVNMNATVATKYQSYNEILMYQELEKLTGVKLKFIHPPAGQGAAQFNMMIASMDLPDLIEHNWTGYQGGAQKAIDDGVIIKLNDLLEDECQNLYAFYKANPTHDKQARTDEGSYFGFPNINPGEYTVFGGLMLRKDWLDELGLDVPETIAEWENVLRRFKDEKGALAPFTGAVNDMITEGNTSFAGAFMTDCTFYLKNGKIVFGPIEPEYREYMELITRWYKEGLIDKDIVTNVANTKDAKISTGEAGSFFGYIGGGMGKYLPMMAEKDPKFDLVGAPFPVMNKGDEAKFVLTGDLVSFPMTAITSACENPNAAAKMMDFFYGEEGRMLQNFGVEGVTYNMENGYPKYSDLIIKNPDGLSIGEAMSLHFRATYGTPGISQDKRYLEQYYPYKQQNDAFELWSKHSGLRNEVYLPNALTPLPGEADEYLNIMSEVKTYVAENAAKFLMGTEPMSNYDSYVETLKGLGIERAIELRQGAYDRYNKR